MIDHNNVFDLNAILHPASVFDHPRDIVAHPTISSARNAPSSPPGPRMPRRRSVKPGVTGATRFTFGEDRRDSRGLVGP
jgi:hypothetical protein